MKFEVESDREMVVLLNEAKQTIEAEIGKVIIGQKEIVHQLLIGVFCKAHCLVEGVPGLAKTLLIRTLAQILDLDYKRIQFTPDLMPSDITGTDVIEEDPHTKQRNFKFIKGPLFGNIILADEINRTPPKTQAALLQAMQEYTVSAGGKTYELDLPFFVLATQNPIEQEGTYPLPEAQLDRFMFNLFIDYPTYEEEQAIIKATTTTQKVELKSVLDGEDIIKLQNIVRKVPISDHVVKYAVDLVRATRPGKDNNIDFVKQYVSWGGGPRAAQYLVLGAKANAILRGDYNVSCKDIQAVAFPTLVHRIAINFAAEAEGVTKRELIQKLISTVEEPKN